MSISCHNRHRLTLSMLYRLRCADCASADLWPALYTAGDHLRAGLFVTRPSRRLMLVTIAVFDSYGKTERVHDHSLTTKHNLSRLFAN